MAIAPREAPKNCPIIYGATSFHGNSPAIARPIVTAGFMCAPLIRPTAYIATVTAVAHAMHITSHPSFSAFVSFNRVEATTPHPK